MPKPNPTKKRIVFTVRLPHETRQRLRQVALDKDLTIQTVVDQAFALYLQKHEKRR